MSDIYLLPSRYLIPTEANLLVLLALVQEISQGETWNKNTKIYFMPSSDHEQNPSNDIQATEKHRIAMLNSMLQAITGQADLNDESEAIRNLIVELRSFFNQENAPTLGISNVDIRLGQEFGFSATGLTVASVANPENLQYELTKLEAEKNQNQADFTLNNHTKTVKNRYQKLLEEREEPVKTEQDKLYIVFPDTTLKNAHTWKEPEKMMQADGLYVIKTDETSVSPFLAQQQLHHGNKVHTIDNQYSMLLRSSYSFKDADKNLASSLISVGKLVDTKNIDQNPLENNTLKLIHQYVKENQLFSPYVLWMSSPQGHLQHYQNTLKHNTQLLQDTKKEQQAESSMTVNICGGSLRYRGISELRLTKDIQDRVLAGEKWMLIAGKEDDRSVEILSLLNNSSDQRSLTEKLREKLNLIATNKAFDNRRKELGEILSKHDISDEAVTASFFEELLTTEELGALREKNLINFQPILPEEYIGIRRWYVENSDLFVVMNQTLFSNTELSGDFYEQLQSFVQSNDNNLNILLQQANQRRKSALSEYVQNFTHQSSQTEPLFPSVLFNEDKNHKFCTLTPTTCLAFKESGIKNVLSNGTPTGVNHPMVKKDSDISQIDTNARYLTGTQFSVPTIVTPDGNIISKTKISQVPSMVQTHDKFIGRTVIIEELEYTVVGYENYQENHKSPAGKEYKLQAKDSKGNVVYKTLPSSTLTTQVFSDIFKESLMEARLRYAGKRTHADYYAVTMAYAIWQTCQQLGNNLPEGVFELFARKNPYSDQPIVIAGMSQVVERLRNFGFSENTLNFLKNEKNIDGHPNEGKSFYSAEFIEFLRNFSFTGDINILPDGTVINSKVPFAVIEGDVLQALLLETLFLEAINGGTMSSTNAAYVKKIVGKNENNNNCILIDAAGAAGTHNGEDVFGRAISIAGYDFTTNPETAQNNKMALWTYCPPSLFELHATAFEAYQDYYNLLPDDKKAEMVFYIPNLDDLNDAYEFANKKQLSSIRLYYCSNNKESIRELHDYIYETWLTENEIEDSNAVKLYVGDNLTIDDIQYLKKHAPYIQGYATGSHVSTTEGKTLGAVYKVVETNGRDVVKKGSEENAGKTTVCSAKEILRFTTKNGSKIDVLFEKQDKNGKNIADQLTELDSIKICQHNVSDILSNEIKLSNLTDLIDLNIPPEYLLIPIIEKGRFNEANIQKATNIKEAKEKASEYFGNSLSSSNIYMTNGLRERFLATYNTLGQPPLRQYRFLVPDEIAGTGLSSILQFDLRVVNNQLQYKRASNNSALNTWIDLLPLNNEESNHLYESIFNAVSAHFPLTDIQQDYVFNTILDNKNKKVDSTWYPKRIQDSNVIQDAILKGQQIKKECSAEIGHLTTDYSHHSQKKQEDALMLHIEDLYTAYAYWKKEQKMPQPLPEKTLEVTVNETPYKHDFIVNASTEFFLEDLRHFGYSQKLLDYFTHQLNFDSKFVDYLKNLRLSHLKIQAMPDGSIARKNDVLMAITGSPIDLALLRSRLTWGYPTAVATKAYHTKNEVSNVLIYMGKRRAMLPKDGVAPIAAYIGGVDKVSDFEITEVPTSGTIAHAFISLHESEREAFVNYGLYMNGKPIVYLVDTYDYRQGTINAIDAFVTLKRAGYPVKLQGLRCDSGDPVETAGIIQDLLVEASQRYPDCAEDLLGVAIILTSDLNETKIHDIMKNLQQQNRVQERLPKFGFFGVGTCLAIADKSHGFSLGAKVVETPENFYENLPHVVLNDNTKTPKEKIQDARNLVNDAREKQKVNPDTTVDWKTLTKTLTEKNSNYPVSKNPNSFSFLNKSSSSEETKTKDPEIDKQLMVTLK